MLYVNAARGGADERGAEAIRRMRRVQDGMPRLTLAQFKALVREQFFMLLIDSEATLAAIPSLLPADEEPRRKAFAILRELLSARGEISGEAAERLHRVARLFGMEGALIAMPPGKSAGTTGKAGVAKAS
jgi:hypothetical protein